MKLPDGSTIDIAIKAPKLCHLTESALVDFYKEAKTTFSLKHDNIVKCLGFSKKPNELPSLIFEFMTYGSLDKILDSNRTKKFQTSCLPTLSYVSSLWQYGLSRFQAGYTKLEIFLPKNQHTQRKLLNFENWVHGRCQKLGIILESKVI